MSRVTWSLMEPGAVEQLVGIFLCRENPSATRIRPSSGDGGIDVLVPEADNPRAVAVYQVKCFHQNLSDGQKGQIERSYHRLRQFAAANDLIVTAWYLTLPLNPTTENREWFLELTAEAEFPCEWRGLDYLEGLAAKYPEVVDYYLHDGKQRLDQAIVALTNVLQLQHSLPRPDQAPQPRQDPTVSLQPAETVGGLTALHDTLNRHDPHFRYDFAVDHEPPPVADAPYLLAAVQQGDADRCVTFKIFARFAEAIVERPIPGSFEIRAEPGSDLHRDLEMFHAYGRPLRTPVGAAAMTLDLPGGLGGSFDQAQLTIGPASSGQQYELRLSVLDEAGVVLAEPLLQMEPSTRGASGRGVRAFGTEEHGVFTFEVMTILDTRLSSFRLKLGNLTGRRPEKLLDGLQFLAQYRSPHRMGVRPAYGPGRGEPIPIEETARISDAASLVLEFAKALVTIQEHVPAPLDMPDLGQIPDAQFSAVLEVARLLRGETLTRSWTAFGPVHVRPGIEPDLASRFALRSRTALYVTLPGVEYQVGIRNVEIFAARIDPETVTVHDDHKDVHFVPAGSDLARITYLSGTDPSVLDQREHAAAVDLSGEVPSS